MKASERSFPLVSVEHQDGRKTALRIECANCGTAANYVVASRNGLSATTARRYFANHGWQVGPVPRRDLCPACAKRKTGQARCGAPETVPAAEPAATPDAAARPMGRDDRRIITAKLDDAYADDGSGYRAPWTDHAVARDLGVSVAWVAEVREQFFGAAASNPELDEVLAEIERLRVRLDDLRGDMPAMVDAATKVFERHANVLARDYALLRSRIDALVGGAA